MDGLLSKIENFLFDILGLVLPRFIFLGALIAPLSLIDMSKFSSKDLDKSYILSELSTINNLFKNYWDEKSTLIIIIIVILSYLFGHFIKVFSIIKYEMLVAIFDKSLNKLINYIFLKLKSFASWIYQALFGQNLFTTKVYLWLKEIFKPIKNTLSKIFTFKSDDYFYDNATLKSQCITIINSRLNTNYPDVWYSIYKFSAIISNQENNKSLSAFFLAKYNLYRSLSFIFLFTAFYFHFCFIASEKYIADDIGKITSLLVLTSSLLWFTFHYKYKRYWTLCGNETLVSLYYFLNKKKINEE